jgi:putative acetyltransferase
MSPAGLESLAIRRAGPSDAAAFARLMSDEAVFAGLLQMPYPSAEQWRQRLEQSAQDQDALPLVALSGEELAASAGVFPVDRRPRRRHCAGIGVSVAAAWQGRGLGREMLRRLLDWSDHWVGYLRLELTVYTDNAPAIALYRDFGFEIEGTHRAYALRRGVLADVHYMARLHPSPPRP